MRRKKEIFVHITQTHIFGGKEVLTVKLWVNIYHNYWSESLWYPKWIEGGIIIGYFKIKVFEQQNCGLKIIK